MTAPRVICEMAGGPSDGTCIDATDPKRHVVLTRQPPPGDRHVYRFGLHDGVESYVYEGVQFRGAAE